MIKAMKSTYLYKSTYTKIARGERGCLQLGGRGLEVHTIIIIATDFHKFVIEDRSQKYCPQNLCDKVDLRIVNESRKFTKSTKIVKTRNFTP